MFVSSLTFTLGFIYSAQAMHSKMLSNVLGWPMWLFDTTPMGRITNRFSKDVETIDNILPQVFRIFLSGFFGVNRKFIPLKHIVIKHLQIHRMVSVSVEICILTYHSKFLYVTLIYDERYKKQC